VNDAPAISIEADPRSSIAYEVTLEPHRRDWLFALEAPAGMPQLDGAQARLTPDMQLLASGLILERIRYEMRSYTDFRLNPRSTLAELATGSHFPRATTRARCSLPRSCAAAYRPARTLPRRHAMPS